MFQNFTKNCFSQYCVAGDLNMSTSLHSSDKEICLQDFLENLE